MKDTEIHNGLNNELLRDFLSNSLIDAYEYVKSNTKKSALPNTFNGTTSSLDWCISSTKSRIFNDGLELGKLEKYKAIFIVAEMNGWEEHDISDYVSKSSYDTLCRSFFGTKEEYDNFMKVNNFEEF